MNMRKIVTNGLTITAAAAVGMLLSPDAFATTGTDLDAGGTTATTIVQGVGGFMMVAGIALTGILWPVYKMNALWGAAPGVAGGLVTTNAKNIATQFGGGAAFDWSAIDWSYLTSGSF